MVVRIRFGRGPVVSRRKGKNGRLATVAAGFLTMVSIICASLGVWRLGADLGWTGDFVVPSGLLSHWLVWLGLAVGIQYGSRQLAGYGALSRAGEEAPETVTPATPTEPVADSAEARAERFAEPAG